LHELQVHTSVIDTTPPLMGLVVDGADALYGEPSTIEASWSASDPESGIAEYKYAVGMTPADPGSGYLQDWTSTVISNAAIGGLNCTSGQTCYVYVKARNNAGLWSDVAVSDGAIVMAITIGQAKLLPEGTRVSFSGVVCPGMVYPFSSFLYVQSPDRSAGILVNANYDYTPGTVVNVSGKLGVTYDGEVCLVYPVTVSTQGSTTLFPLGVNNSAIGGGSMGLQASIWGWRWICRPGSVPEYKWLPDCGLNNVGLLIKTTGRLTYIDPAGRFAYVDDGSHADDGITLDTNGSSVKGIRLSLDGRYSQVHKTPPVGADIAVTGVSSCSKINGKIVSVLKTRFQKDIAGVGGAMIFGKISHTTPTTVLQTIESPHPCPNNYYQTWHITGPEGAASMRLHFPTIQVSGSDYLRYGTTGGDTTLVRSFNGEKWTDWFAGDKADLILYMYNSGNYGFLMDKYEVLLPAKGVTVTLMPGCSTAVTDSRGYFVFPNLAPGSYTVTPSMNGVVFNPPNGQAVVEAMQIAPEINFTTD
jgi:hypothetical protein